MAVDDCAAAEGGGGEEGGLKGMGRGLYSVGGVCVENWHYVT